MLKIFLGDTVVNPGEDTGGTTVEDGLRQRRHLRLSLLARHTGCFLQEAFDENVPRRISIPDPLSELLSCMHSASARTNHFTCCERKENYSACNDTLIQKPMASGVAQEANQRALYGICPSWNDVKDTLQGNSVCCCLYRDIVHCRDSFIPNQKY